MKPLLAILLVSMLAWSGLAANTYTPVSLRIDARQYVLFGPRLLVFDLPQMNLVADKLYGTDISFPPIYTHSGNIIYFGNGKGGHFEIDLNSGYTLSQFDTALPPGGAGAEGFLQLSFQQKLCVTEATVTYCFNGGNAATVTRTEGTSVITIPLNQTLDVSRFVKLDVTNGTLYVTGQKSVPFPGRGADNMVLFIFNLSPFSLRYASPITLLHTADNGCPTGPRLCNVDVLLYMDAAKGIVSYLYSNALPSSTPGGDLTFRLTLVAYSFNPCLITNAVFNDVSTSVPPVIGKSACSPQTCNGTGVCGATDKCCQDYKTGRRCYNPNLASCSLDEDLRTVLCGFFDGACNGVCYDARHYKCENGVLKFTGKRAIVDEV